MKTLKNLKSSKNSQRAAPDPAPAEVAPDREGAVFDKILIANRGEIACRVIRTARRMGIRTVAVYSDADKGALHARAADEAVHIGPPEAAESYLAIDRIVEAVARSGAQAVHPGYGFLSERAEFADALEAAGTAFIGPPKGAIEAMGDKIASKKLAADAGVPTVPGHAETIKNADEAVRIAEEIGWPVMIKASAGGGGKGMRVVRNAEETRDGFQSAKNEAASGFGDDRVFIEKFIARPRHIEIQILADKHGNRIHLGERECSIQRRNQKVIEEAPSPFLDDALRRDMGERAVALAKAVDYHSAGTVEFILDEERNFYFLEMNTRLQVEHAVTELITGEDLVEHMIRIAAGEKLTLTQDDVKPTGWAIESRLYAEDPHRNFLPSTGRLTRYRPPATADGGDGAERADARTDGPAPAVVRNDTGVFEGGEISIHYDPMIAKLCTWGADRAAAVEAMRDALDEFEIEGIGHNLPFLSAVMDHPRFVAGEITTAFIDEEYPDGFQGATPDDAAIKRIAAGAAAMQLVVARRAGRIGGTITGTDRPPNAHWVVTVAGRVFRVAATRIADGFARGGDGGGPGATSKGRDPRRPHAPIHGRGAVEVVFQDEVAEDGATGGETITVRGDWTPGDTLTVAAIDGWRMAVKVTQRTEGFRIRHRGADLEATVRTPRAAELAATTPEKPPPDASKTLRCPMPGRVVSIAVREGDEVRDGQALATVEAMKMENTLRAERKAVVGKVVVRAGDVLAADDAIMEFE